MKIITLQVPDTVDEKDVKMQLAAHFYDKDLRMLYIDFKDFVDTIQYPEKWTLCNFLTKVSTINKSLRPCPYRG